MSSWLLNYFRCLPASLWLHWVFFFSLHSLKVFAVVCTYIVLLLLSEIESASHNPKICPSKSPGCFLKSRGSWSLPLTKSESLGVVLWIHILSKFLSHSYILKSGCFYFKCTSPVMGTVTHMDEGGGGAPQKILGNKYRCSSEYHVQKISCAKSTETWQDMQK